MRTTLTIDDDVYDRVRAIARSQRRSLGEVVSDLMRQTMETPEPLRFRNGVPLLPARGGRVTIDMINKLRDEED
jgi:hypothetical protein